MIIRPATLQDAARILEIYRYYVEHTAISFEHITPTPAEFTERMRQTMQHYPYFVAEVDGVVQGYAYAGPLKNRAAYNWVCETTIYLAADAQKCGIGRRLYQHLGDALKQMGIISMYACVAYPTQPDEYLTTNSADFHQHIGFVPVGTFGNCGCKFGRWYSMVWLQKNLAAPTVNPAPVTPYPQL